jgi:predicted nicotinamide N-methyase
VALNASRNGCTASVNGVVISAESLARPSSYAAQGGEGEGEGEGEGGAHEGGGLSADGQRIELAICNLVGKTREELGQPDVLIAGDVMYEDELSKEVTKWLQRLARDGCKGEAAKGQGGVGMEVGEGVGQLGLLRV